MKSNSPLLTQTLVQCRTPAYQWKLHSWLNVTQNGVTRDLTASPNNTSNISTANTFSLHPTHHPETPPQPFPHRSESPVSSPKKQNRDWNCPQSTTLFPTLPDSLVESAVLECSLYVNCWHVPKLPRVEQKNCRTLWKVSKAVLCDIDNVCYHRIGYHMRSCE